MKFSTYTVLSSFLLLVPGLCFSIVFCLIVAQYYFLLARLKMVCRVAVLVFILFNELLKHVDFELRHVLFFLLTCDTLKFFRGSIKDRFASILPFVFASSFHRLDRIKAAIDVPGLQTRIILRFFTWRSYIHGCVGVDCLVVSNQVETCFRDVTSNSVFGGTILRSRHSVGTTSKITFVNTLQSNHTRRSWKCLKIIQCFYSTLSQCLDAWMTREGKHLIIRNREKIHRIQSCNTMYVTMYE